MGENLEILLNPFIGGSLVHTRILEINYQTFNDKTFDDQTFNDHTFNDQTLNDQTFNDQTFNDQTFNASVQSYTENQCCGARAARTQVGRTNFNWDPQKMFWLNMFNSV